MSGAFGTVNFTRRFSAADYSELLDAEPVAAPPPPASNTSGGAGTPID